MQTKDESNVKRVAWVANNLTTGGIGTVCRYAADGVARTSGYCATVVSLRPPPTDRIDPLTGVRYVSLGLQQDAPQAFLRWLTGNPHQFVISNDVQEIESAFPHFSRETLHIIGIHDSSRPKMEVAVRNHAWIDGVACVAMHIQRILVARMKSGNFRELVETVHNGAVFPPSPARTSVLRPLRLLFMGSMDPFKGIFDLVPILQILKNLGVPVRLVIAGGSHDLLARRIKSKQLDSLVTWAGWVTHEECYRLAGESDVLLMPSRKEAFGMVTIEAMGMGCVPLAYDIKSGSREIIENGESGLLLPLGDFTAWAKAIKFLHENREEWRRLSEGATARARTHFNADIMASRLCAFLERVQTNAQICPSKRLTGLPPQDNSAPRAPRSSYQRLSPSLRIWVRNWIGASPRLCHWLLNRW